MSPRTSILCLIMNMHLIIQHSDLKRKLKGGESAHAVWSGFRTSENVRSDESVDHPLPLVFARALGNPLQKQNVMYLC